MKNRIPYWNVYIPHVEKDRHHLISIWRVIYLISIAVLYNSFWDARILSTSWRWTPPIPGCMCILPARHWKKKNQKLLNRCDVSSTNHVPSGTWAGGIAPPTPACTVESILNVLSCLPITSSNLVLKILIASYICDCTEKTWRNSLWLSVSNHSSNSLSVSFCWTSGCSFLYLSTFSHYNQNRQNPSRNENINLEILTVPFVILIYVDIPHIRQKAFVDLPL